MLKKVRIKNFLSCEDTEFDLDQITVLIGRNAAGKTTILKFIEWAAQFIIGAKPISEYETLSKSFSIEFLMDESILKYEMEFSEDYTEHNEKLLCYIDNKFEIISEKNGGEIYYSELNKKISINEDASMLSSLISLLPKEDSSYISRVSNYLSKIKYYTFSVELEDNNAIYPPVIIDNSDYKKLISKKNKDDLPTVIKLLHLWKEDNESLDELKALLGKNGLGLIHNIQIEHIENHGDVFYLVAFFPEDSPINYYRLSYGTQRVLMILLALLYDKSSTLLIEQPEDGIHLGLLRKVLSICFEYAEVYNKQLIISTHSPKVINMFPAKSIRFVKMTEQGTKVTQLSEKELAVIPEYLNNEGTLSDFIEAMDDE